MLAYNCHRMFGAYSLPSYLRTHFCRTVPPNSGPLCSPIFRPSHPPPFLTTSVRTGQRTSWCLLGASVCWWGSRGCRTIEVARKGHCLLASALFSANFEPLSLSSRSPVYLLFSFTTSFHLRDKSLINVEVTVKTGFNVHADTERSWLAAKQENKEKKSK